MGSTQVFSRRLAGQLWLKLDETPTLHDVALLSLLQISIAEPLRQNPF